MKRALHIFSALIMIAALASCLQVDEGQPVRSEAIRIVHKGVTPETKGAIVETSNLIDNYENYKIYAYTGTSTTPYINNEDYTLDETEFKTERTYTWTTSSLGFWIYPKDQPFVSNLVQTSENVSFSYSHPQGVDDNAGNDAVNSKDALFAYTTANPGQDVNVTFRHALAGIKVVYSQLRIAHHITNITVTGINTAGACTFDKSNQFTWESTQSEGTYSQDMETYVTQDGHDLTDGEMTFFVVPGTGFSVDVTLDNGRHATEQFPDAVLTSGKCAMVYIKDDMTFPENPDAPTDKVIDANGDGTYCITIEAYILGETSRKVTETPTDFVLVLDVSGSMDYTLDGKSTNTESKRRIYALKQAVKDFADTVAAHSTKYQVEHRVSIVKFASEKSNTVGNGKNSSRYNYSQIVNKFTNNMTTVKNNVNALSSGGGTRINLGLEHAKQLFTDESRSDAKKICIIFTDGGPGDYGWDSWSSSGTDSEGGTKYTAQHAASLATDIKNLGATVFTVGIFSETGTSAEMSDEFMDRLSSNYSGVTTFNFTEGGTRTELGYTKNNNWVVLAQNLPWNGTLYYSNGWKYKQVKQDWTASNLSQRQYYAKDGSNYYKVSTKSITGSRVYQNGVKDQSKNYYKKTTSASELASIFAEIAAIGTAHSVELDLDETAVTYDIVSDAFAIPEGYGVNDITFYSVAQTGWSEDGDGNINITWSDQLTPVTYLDWEFIYETKTLNVTGWNYTENCCGKGCNGTGHKLVMKLDNLPIRTDIQGLHYTNEFGSGIYDSEGNLVIEFNSPSVTLNIAPSGGGN